MKETVAPVITKTFKIALLNVFKEVKRKLEPFLFQIKMNVYFNKPQFKNNTNKVLYTAIYLKDNAVK